jgi:hypothetical protein
LNIGTWNVLSILRPGALDILVQALKNAKMDITAVQETRWPGTEILQKKNFCFYYSGGRGRYRSGTGFIVNKKAMDAVIGWLPINDRLCSLRVRCKYYNVTIINVHAPTEDKSTEVKEEYYDELERLIARIPSRDIKIVLGDFNAKVGRESVFFPTIGRHSLHKETNDNGNRLIGLAASNNLRIGSTIFRHKNIHKGTWKIPGTDKCNQIDHIAIDANHVKDMIDVRSFRGPNVDSDHYLVGMKLRQTIPHTHQQVTDRPSKWDVVKLKQDETREKYRHEIALAITPAIDDASDSVGYSWNRIQKILKETAEKTIGSAAPSRRNKWFDSECESANREKNEARLRMLQRHTRQNENEYKEKRKFQQRLCRKKKREYEQNEIQDIVEAAEMHDSRIMYKKVNALRTEYKPHTTSCLDREGNILCDRTRVLQRWVEYFDELLNEGSNEASDNQQQVLTAEPYIEEPTYQETVDAILKLKNNKAPGLDGLPAELFKYGGPDLWNEIHKLIIDIWSREDLPVHWKTGILCPLHKKGNRLVCSNYRGIVLLNTAYKIFAHVLHARLLPYAEQQVGEYQCGFRRNRSTIDHLFSIRQIMEKCYEYNITTHHLFVDFKNAYDKVKRQKLWSALEFFGVPQKLINLAKLTLSDVNCRVRIGNDLSDPFENKEGLRQGDGLAQLFFNMVLEYAIRSSRIETNGTIFHKTSQILAYADDVDLIARNVNQLQQNLETFKGAAQNVGLVINQQKTKYLTATRNQTARNSNLGNQAIEHVDSFVYLGSEINSDNDISLEIKRRIQLGNKTYFGLSKLMRSRTISRRLKCTLYKTLIRPVVTYGSETWCMTVEHERQLACFERKILRKIYGPVQDNNIWRIRYNHELKALYGEPDIVRFIKIGRLRWAGHVTRMDDGRVPSRLLNATPEGRRTQGGQRKRWLDAVNRDARLLGIADWRRAAQNRTTWRQNLRDAQSH